MDLHTACSYPVCFTFCYIFSRVPVEPCARHFLGITASHYIAETNSGSYHLPFTRKTLTGGNWIIGLDLSPDLWCHNSLFIIFRSPRTINPSTLSGWRINWMCGYSMFWIWPTVRNIFYVLSMTWGVSMNTFPRGMLIFMLLHIYQNKSFID